MQKLKWSAVLQQLPRAALFSFGIAVCVFILASVGSVGLAGGEYAFGPSEGRIVFKAAFVVSLVVYVVVAMLRAKGDSADEVDRADGGSK